MSRRRSPAPGLHKDRVEYTPLASAVKIHNSDAQVKAICGPVGSGKTTVGCWEHYFLFAEASIPLRTCILRESFPQLRDSSLKTWMEWFGGCSVHLKGDNNIRVRLRNPEGHELEHEIHLRHARRPEEASNLLSTEYALIQLSEPVPAYQKGRGVVGNGLSKEIFTMATTRLRQKGAHRTQIILDFNPPPRHHWVYKEFWQKSEVMKDLGYELFKQPARENLHNLNDPAYYDDMAKRFDPEFVKRFVDGEPVTMYSGRPVWPECYESVHFRERLEVMPGFPLVIGFDYGNTPVALITQILPGGRLHCLQEIQLFNAGVKTLGQELRQMLATERFDRGLEIRCWGDPSGAAKSPTDERTCVEILATFGFEVRPGAIDFTSRRTAVADRFQTIIDGEPGILIDTEHCPTLAEGIGGAYRFPEYHDGHVGRLPLKNQYSHTADSLQMICTGEFSAISGKSRAQQEREEIREATRPRHDPLSLDEHGPRGSWMGK